MAFWPLKSSSSAEVEMTVPTSCVPQLVAVVASSTAHTKGAWTELTAAAPDNVTGFCLSFGDAFTNAGFSATVLEIGIGAAGSEVTLVPDFAIGGQAATLPAIWLPIKIPNGVRVAARIQSVTGSRSVNVSWAFRTGSPMSGATSYGRATSYGVNLATSYGVAVTAAGGGTSWGAWAEIVASTTNPVRALVPTVGTGGSNTVAAADVAFEYGFGASGSEQVLGAGFAQANASEYMIPKNDVPFGLLDSFGAVPEGSRLVARAKRSVAGNVDYDCSFLGLD